MTLHVWPCQRLSQKYFLPGVQDQQFEYNLPPYLHTGKVASDLVSLFRCFCSLPVILDWGLFLSPKGPLTMSGDLFDCHSSCYGMWEGGHCWHPGGGESTDAAKYPTIHRTLPTVRNFLALNTSSVKLRNPALFKEVRVFSLNSYLVF